VDEEYCVGSIDSAVWESCKPSKFICRGFVPDYVMFWAAYELSIFEVLSVVFITDELDTFTLFFLSELHVSSVCPSLALFVDASLIFSRILLCVIVRGTFLDFLSPFELVWSSETLCP
jgi:hypothetical protein